MANYDGLHLSNYFQLVLLAYIQVWEKWQGRLGSLALGGNMSHIFPRMHSNSDNKDKELVKCHDVLHLEEIPKKKKKSLSMANQSE